MSDREGGDRAHAAAPQGGTARSDAGVRDDALESARAVLQTHGLPVNVERAGHAGDMLVVEAPPGRIDDVRACAPELRKLGFRYVTIEIVPGEIVPGEIMPDDIVPGEIVPDA